jgi:hypothetical protein
MISRFFQNFRGKSQVDSQLTVDVIPYNNRKDGGPAAGLLSLVEVPEKAIVPFMVNAFDYVTFIHKMSRAFRIISTVNIYTIPKW